MSNRPLRNNPTFRWSGGREDNIKQILPHVPDQCATWWIARCSLGDVGAAPFVVPCEYFPSKVATPATKMSAHRRSRPYRVELKWEESRVLPVDARELC
eukprot:8545644-Pyramimonas_sp.AAC.1